MMCISLPGGGYKPTKVLGIYEDSISVEEDLLFYDEIGKTWCLHERTAKDYTKKPIKCAMMLT